VQGDVVAARRAAGKWANSVHQFEELDVLEQILVAIAHSQPDLARPVEQTASQLQVVAGDEIDGGQELARVEEDLLLGQVGKEGRLDPLDGQAELGHRLGQDLLAAGPAEQVQLARHRPPAKEGSAQVSRFDRRLAACAEPSGSICAEPLGFTRHRRRSIRAAGLEHRRQAPDDRVVEAVPFVVTQGLGQRAPTVPHVPLKEGGQFAGDRQIAIVGRQAPGPDLSAAHGQPGTDEFRFEHWTPPLRSPRHFGLRRWAMRSSTVLRAMTS